MINLQYITTMSSEKIWKYSTILSGIGIILATYLLYNTLAPHPIQVCNVNAWINCNPVTKGNLAYFLGIPVALIGLIGYLTILYAVLNGNKKLFLGVTGFGMLFCIRLLILELFVERIICPVCIACMLVMTMLFVLAIVMYQRKETVTQKMLHRVLSLLSKK